MAINLLISRIIFFYATDVDDLFPYVTMGSELPLTAELSTVTLITFSMSGSSNIVFKRIFSKIDLNPLAPVFFLIAFCAISLSALSLNVSLAPSSLNNS